MLCFGGCEENYGSRPFPPPDTGFGWHHSTFGGWRFSKFQLGFRCAWKLKIFFSWLRYIISSLESCRDWEHWRSRSVNTDQFWGIFIWNPTSSLCSIFNSCYLAMHSRYEHFCGRMHSKEAIGIITSIILSSLVHQSSLLRQSTSFP